MLATTLRFAALWVVLAVLGLLLLNLLGVGQTTYATLIATWGAFAVTAALTLWWQRRARR